MTASAAKRSMAHFFNRLLKRRYRLDMTSQLVDVHHLINWAQSSGLCGHATLKYANINPSTIRASVSHPDGEQTLIYIGDNVGSSIVP